MTDCLIERDGARLRIVDTGGPEPVLLFQHGLCGSEEQVAEVLPASLPHRRITLECRGHGGSGPGDPARFSIAAFADDVAAAAAACGVTRAVLGGISMGAAIALRLAVHRPDLVRALVLARPAWATEAAPENLAPNRLVGDLLASRPAPEALAAFRSSAMRERLVREAPDNVASLDSFFTREPVGITSALLRTISADGPGVSLDEIAALRVPILVIGTARDAIHPIALARTLAAMNERARLVEITPKGEDKARHLAEFRAAVLAFLDTID